MNNPAEEMVGGPTRTEAFAKRLEKRYRAERRFRALGMGAIIFSVYLVLARHSLAWI